MAEQYSIQAETLMKVAVEEHAETLEEIKEIFKDLEQD